MDLDRRCDARMVRDPERRAAGLRGDVVRAVRIAGARDRSLAHAKVVEVALAARGTVRVVIAGEPWIEVTLRVRIRKGGIRKALCRTDLNHLRDRGYGSDLTQIGSASRRARG